jgi:tetratricopeptide (TPR) repeat protein
LNEPKNFRAIMLSSTFTDLKQHRQKVIDAIGKLDYMPRVMEHSGARAAADVIESSLNMVRDSVAYFCIISLKYGQTPVDPVRNPKRLSITELEFNEAVRLGRPIILFIMGDEHPVKKADIEATPGKRKKLDTFRKQAKRMGPDSEVERICETFEDLDQFAHAAVIALGNLVRDLERVAPHTGTGIVPKPPGVVSNIPITVPLHFLGRDRDLAAIDAALKSSKGSAAITALHGLRGVGKTTLAAAYAEHHRNDYRAAWWIRAQNESTMRADLVGLAVRLGWVAADEEEEPALVVAMDRLRNEGDGVLLIYDNAIGADQIRKHLPRGGAAKIIITSNAPNWSGIATSVEIEVWEKYVGADYLIAQAARDGERDAALSLSEVLGGLPLAHEQAAAYCERLGISFSDYLNRFAANPAKLLNAQKDAPHDYGRTVATTFALAIDEAAKLHPAAAPLISYAALLAPEPIPLFLFSEAREQFGESFASDLAGDGLDEAVAALRSFALLDREAIPDERDPSITTDCIRLHRLVHHVVAASERDKWEDIRRTLIAALVAVYPDNAYRKPEAWSKIRRLDAIAMALLGSLRPPEGTENSVANMLVSLGAYRHYVLGAYLEARPLYERALSIAEEAFGHQDRKSLICATFLAILLKNLGDIDAACPLFERVLEMTEALSGPDHLDTASALNNLGTLLEDRGDLELARSRYERALKIREGQLGPEHPGTALVVGNIGSVLYRQGDLVAARPMLERSLAVREKAIGPDHPEISANLLNLSSLFFAEGDLAKALHFSERALSMDERVFSPEHPRMTSSVRATATVLIALGRTEDAIALREKFKLDPE